MLRLPSEPNSGQSARAADARLLLRAVRSMHPASSSTIRVQMSGSGTTYHVIGKGKDRNTTPAPLPFSVSVIDNGDGTYSASVFWDSTLLTSIIPTLSQSITGLAAQPAPPAPQELNAFNLDGNDFIWLEVGFNTTTALPNAATICSYGLGSHRTWTPNVDSFDPDIMGTDGPVLFTTTNPSPGITLYSQTYARFPIAEATAGPTGAPVLRQLLTQNLMLQTVTVGPGVTMPYPIPWGGGQYR